MALEHFLHIEEDTVGEEVNNKRTSYHESNHILNKNLQVHKSERARHSNSTFPKSSPWLSWVANFLTQK